MAAIFEWQWLHALALAVMLPTLWLISMNCGCFHRGELWGISTWNWFWISVEIPIAHLYIWVHYLTTEQPDMRRIYGTAG